MESKDDLERVLRDIRVFLSKGRIYEKNKSFVVVNKNEAYNLLSRFMDVLEEIRDDYELTKQSREQAQRDAKHRGDYIVKKAHEQAEDVYAASVLYTEDALGRVQDIMKDASKQIEKTMKEFQNTLKKNQEVVKENQSELKEQLQNMKDTEKYIKLIDTVNRQREEERKKKEGDKKKTIQNEGSRYAKPEIKINRAYFEAHGIPVNPDTEESEETHIAEQNEKTIEKPEIHVNLDSEYFKWKNSEKKPEKDIREEKKKPESQDIYQEDLYDDTVSDMEEENDGKEKKGRFFSFGKK